MSAMSFIWLNAWIKTCLQSPWYIEGDNFMWIYAVVSSSIHNLHIKINVYISDNLFEAETVVGIHYHILHWEQICIAKM